MGNRKTEHIKRVLTHIKPYKHLLISSLFMALIAVALQLYIPVLVGQAVDKMVGPNNVNLEAIAKIMLAIAVATVGSSLAQWCMGELNNRLTFRVVRDVREEAFRHIQNLPLSYLDAHPYGETVSCVIADVDQFADGLLLGFTQFFTGIITILGTLFFMFRLSWTITLVVVFITPVSLLVANFIAKRTYSMFRLQAETRARQTAIIDETIGEMKVVQAFGHEEKSQADFEKVNEELRKCSLRAIFFSSLTNPCTRFVNSLVYAAAGLTGALACIHSGSLTIGGLTSFLSYANQYTKPFNEISGVVTELQNALACAGRVFDLIDSPVQTPDSLDTGKAHQQNGRVDLENVAFCYSPDKPLIRNFSLHVSPGQRIAIVGQTGCGKTTLINLLMRFYDVDSGQILVDGIPTEEMTRNVLRSGFEAGGSLSQGQKQLLCIARVMLCLPPILILDEATSSIDTRTEQKIQKAFSSMMEGRTSFIVAHRLSTIQEADVILVMKDGQIIEQGNHENLLEKNGFYRKLYESQFAK